MSEQADLVYCEVPKAACTSWKAVIAELSGKVNKEERRQLHDMVHDTRKHKEIGIRSDILSSGLDHADICPTIV